jgi:dUTPase
MDGYHTPIFKFALREDLKEDKRFLPTRAEPKATGWDVRAAMPDKKSLLIRPFQQIKIPLGIRGFCPDGWWYEMKPRSSTFGKKNLHALYGTIDETYEGELIFAAQYIPELFLFREGENHHYSIENRITAYSALHIDFGDAIAQIIPVRREEMIVGEVTNEFYDKDCLNRAAVRGSGGFGSTGR